MFDELTKKKLIKFHLLQEFLMLCSGAKPAVKTLITNSGYKSLKSLCEQNSLFIKKSDFEMVLDREKDLVFRKPPSNNASSLVAAFISTSRNVAEKICDAYEKDDHKQIGLLLGYPVCCTEHYIRSNKKYDMTSTLYFDRVLHSYWNTKGVPSFCLNNIYLGDPYYLIFHFPCSYNCKKSIAIAKKTLALLEAEDPLFAREVISLLKSPALYSGYSTLFFKGQVFQGNKILYSGVYESTRPGITSWFDLAAFRKGNLVEILKGKIKIFRDQQPINELNMPEKFVLFNGEEKNNSERYVGNACG